MGKCKGEGAMFIGREAELKFLNNYYAKEGSQILVVYGQRGVGKSALLQYFGKDKKCSFYTARACSAREQLYQWGSELREQGRDVARFPAYGELFEHVFEQEQTEKQILVVEEFHHIIKSDEAFLTELILMLEIRRLARPVMVILCTSASGWVENSMLTKIGNRATAISGLLKVREFKFEEMCRLFPGYKMEDAVRIYAALGGVPGLWSSFDDKLSAKDNMIQNILRKDCRLYEEMAVYIAEELREPAVYYTILSAMARDCSKLNDIYRHTGFSRAKISVYLKNLMELELVEKMFSGTYRIANSYVRFYFRFLFPHKSMLNSITPQEYYDKYVDKQYADYVEESYRQICREILAREAVITEEWCWKSGNVYLMSKSQEGLVTVGACSYAKEFTSEDYDWLLFCMKNAKVRADRIVLFGEAGCVDSLSRRIQQDGTILRSIQ